MRTSVSTIFVLNKENVMKDLNTVFCHQHSHSQPRYPHFTLCSYCREEAPHEAIVVEAAVNYFSAKLPDSFIETELEIQMGTTKRRADIVLVDGKQNHVAIVECKRIGVQEDGIAQLKSYLCATDTLLGVFANSTKSNDWKFIENLGRNRFKDITSDVFWKNIRNTSEEESLPTFSDAETYYNKGTEKVKLGQYNDAIVDYNMAIQLKPDDANTYVARGAAKGALEQYAAAIADFNNAIQLKPNDAYAYYFRALMKVSLGQHTAATDDHGIAIQLKPDYAEAYYHRGEAKRALGQRAAAIDDYGIAIQLKPDYAEAYCHRGKMKAGLGQHAAAIADYDNVIKLKPDYAEAYYHRGEAKIFMSLWKLGTIGEYNAAIVDAIADFDNTIRLKPDHAQAYERGNAKVKLEQYAAAIDDYDNAIRLEPNCFPAYYERGNAKVKLEQYAAAITDYDTAIRLDPDYDTAYHRRGEVKELMGKTFAAMVDFHRASRAYKRRWDV